MGFLSFFFFRFVCVCRARKRFCTEVPWLFALLNFTRATLCGVWLVTCLIMMALNSFRGLSSVCCLLELPVTCSALVALAYFASSFPIPAIQRSWCPWTSSTYSNLIRQAAPFGRMAVAREFFAPIVYVSTCNYNRFHVCFVVVVVVVPIAFGGLCRALSLLLCVIVGQTMIAAKHYDTAKIGSNKTQKTNTL